MNPFDRNQAFSRTIGFVTPDELELLRRKRIAIAGLGGVGGIHLITLTRLGIGNFNISDFDSFALENFNRQYGAKISTIDRPKSSVMAEEAFLINPDLDIKIFGQAIHETNVDDFLLGVELFVDSLDYFAFDARKLIYRKCRAKGIPIVTAGPIGMSSALIIFTPESMPLEEYFDWRESDTPKDLAIKFLLGISPRGKQFSYLIYPQALNFDTFKGPSTPMACQMCAGHLGTQALKILLNRGPIKASPHSFQFDAYYNKMIHTYLPFGNRGLFQRFKFWMAKRSL